MERHQNLSRFRTVDRTVVAVLVEEGKDSTMVEMSVRNYDAVELLKVKLVSVKARVSVRRVVCSRVYPAIEKDGTIARLDQHCCSAHFPKRAEGYEPNVARFAECRPKDSLTDIS